MLSINVGSTVMRNALHNQRTTYVITYNITGVWPSLLVSYMQLYSIL